LQQLIISALRQLRQVQLLVLDRLFQALMIFLALLMIHGLEMLRAMQLPRNKSQQRQLVVADL
jgi:hypothetical protein